MKYYKLIEVYEEVAVFADEDENYYISPKYVDDIAFLARMSNLRVSIKLSVLAIKKYPMWEVRIQDKDVSRYILKGWRVFKKETVIKAINTWSRLSTMVQPSLKEVEVILEGSIFPPLDYENYVEEIREEM